MARKKNHWTDGSTTVEIYRSTVSVGSRYSLAPPAPCYNIRGASFGTNNFCSRVRAETFLSERGFRKITA